uniref:Trithorax group protein osa n=1 Tax=Panagrellus redivivus TaxID=6233 RepID=A0A7E4ZQW2_PANRE
MQNDQNPPTPQDGVPGNLQQAPRSNQSGPSPGRFAGIPSVENLNQPSPASQRGHLHPNFQMRPGFMQAPLGDHGGPTPSPRSQGSSGGGGPMQFRPVRSPMNRSASGNSQVPSNYYNQNSPYANMNYNPMGENPSGGGGYGSSAASMQSAYRGQPVPFPSSNPGSVQGPGGTGNSPFPGPGPSSGGIGLGGQAPVSRASPFPGPGPGSNAGFPGPGPSSNTLGFPGPGPSGSSPFPGSGSSAPNPSTYYPPRSNENPGFGGLGPSGVPQRPSVPTGSVSFRPELSNQPPILQPQVPQHQVQQMQQDQYIRQQQQEFLRQNPRFISQPQPRPHLPPGDAPGPSNQPIRRVSPPPQAFQAPAPEPIPPLNLDFPLHLVPPPFPGPGPDPDDSPNEPWKDRVISLVPAPTITLISLEGLHNQSVGYLCGFAKDIIQEINTRVIHIMGTCRNPNWTAALFADTEVEFRYTRYLMKKLVEIRTFVDRRLIDTPDITANEFIQMVAFSSEKPKIPAEVEKLREEFAKNTDLLIQISSRMKEAEWLSACGDPRATGSSTRDDLIRMTNYEESRRRQMSRGGM